MADTAILSRAAGETNSASEQLRSEIVRAPAPAWSALPATKRLAQELTALDIKAPALAKKAAFEGQRGILGACVEAVGAEVQAARWVVTLMTDMLREDSSCFSLFETALASQVPIYQPLFAVISKQGSDQYVADKAAWLLSSVMGHVPHYFKEQQVADVAQALGSPSSPCSELGRVEGYVNLLKADTFRGLVWSRPGISEIVSSVNARGAPPPYLYKCVFAYWLMSFDAEETKLEPAGVVHKIKDFLSTSRVEKVVRLSLTVLKNLLGQKAYAEQIVEQGVLEVVQQLEYEKWRDAELYDDIRDLASQISVRVSEMSNFDRYQKELNEGRLKWGFIHSAKFWAENALKFEQNDYRALKDLALLLQSPKSDATTLAVACHDLGEFVVCHPLGKKLVTQFGVKQTVMDLMASQKSEHREVRREALLCCQKFMLNKWGDMDTVAA